jgi:hypothetical protein
MTDEQIIIAIAGDQGWQGVPVGQQWIPDTFDKKPIKYWRSVTPVEIIDATGSDYCSGSTVARWLRKPDGKPLILERQHAGYINNRPTFVDKPVLQEFNREQWPRNNDWNFCRDPWPEVTPSLEPFVKHLPRYLENRDAMYEVLGGLNANQFHIFRKHLRWLVVKAYTHHDPLQGHVPGPFAVDCPGVSDDKEIMGRRG